LPPKKSKDNGEKHFCHAFLSIAKMSPTSCFKRHFFKPGKI
jgi:hypothetical protein